ncbi:xanthine dehydrogenase family protein subunit M [Bacillus salipaludis]|uniref:Xanthine dehydrogenase family protein subunit M n=1 Tax=Bacillus salipaludis TaxID=2547811 RepID=A0A4R5VL65_9BACI|nr:xanthine dehydrogenase family protein subunit M [Bacillus salipaludis]MDQ6596592.1 xanthine dehydrogenase family protein subunit M [Bacillus salipaludis]TDK58494.1 xanthine dehydrogenase family protein subunit M [Bacillus salipaludis]
MKPAKFNYLRPSSIEEAVQYLSEYGEDAKIISGGQSLIPLLNMRLSTPKYLIDLGRAEGLGYIREDGEFLVIGALTKHCEIEKSELVKEKCPLLSEAIRWVGHAQIRNRGTVGGSIAHGDPSAELPCVITALRGEIVIADANGEEVFCPEEFFLTYMLTSLQPDQLVKEVRFPITKPSSGSAFVEVARRHGDFGLVEVAAVVDLDADSRFLSVNLAIGGVNSVPTPLEDVEKLLIGKEASEEIYEEAGNLTMEIVEPESDLHGTAEYRRELSGTIVIRALKQATERAQGGGGL